MKRNFMRSGFVGMKKNKDIFNDFTHGSIDHVLRRITKNLVESNYPEHELEYLVRLGTEVYIRVGCEFFSLMNDVAAIRQLREKASVFPRTKLE